MADRASHKLILLLGSLGYVGFVPLASGTVAVAVVGIPLFYLMHGLHWVAYAVIAVAVFLAAVFLSERGDQILQEKDSSKMVIDEIVGYLVAVFGLPFTGPVVVVSFLLERAIDIIKVPPANWIEKRVPGGWGVVLDDVVAGAYTLIIMHIILQLRPQWLLSSIS